MKKIFIPALSAIILFAGCQKNEMNNSFGEYDAPEYVTASVPATKVHLDGLKTSWHKSDRISLFAKSDAMHFYNFDKLTDGNNVASFKYHSQGTEATMSLDKNYCVYPDRGVTNGVSDNTANADGILTTRIVNSQKYNADNLLDYAPMVAVADDWNFTFKNVASVIRFNVKKSADFTDECVLNSIRLESASEALSGKLSVDTKDGDDMVAIPDAGANLNVNITEIGKVITTDAQSFCVAVFPTTFEAQDLKIILNYNDDAKKIVTYPAPLTLRPGTVQDINCTMKPEVAEEESSVDITTGDIYKFNDHPHLTCYTASVEGGVTVVDENVTVSELGVLFQRSGKEEDLVIGNVGTNTNDVRQVKASVVKENVVLRLTNLVGGSDGATKYAYRFYAVLNDGKVVYGATKEFRTDVYGFVPVKAGTFTMGADSGQPGANTANTGKTNPAHQVRLTTDFEISKYELAVPQYAAFLNAKGVVPATNTDSELTAKIDNKIVYLGKVTDNGEKMSIEYNDGKWDGTARKKYPVERITKYGVELYCQWLTETENDGYTYRLPTEAEWEWAAMGGILSKGYKYSGSNNLNDVGVPKNSSNTNVQQTTAVLGTKYPNELGIYDMSGNLWEVVSDRSDYNWLDGSGVAASYFAFCHAQGTVTDPQGPDAADGYTFDSDKYYCIRKGGSVNDVSSGQNFCPHYRRLEGVEKTTHRNDTGFRIVRVKNN